MSIYSNNLKVPEGIDTLVFLLNPVFLKVTKNDLEFNPKYQWIYDGNTARLYIDRFVCIRRVWLGEYRPEENILPFKTLYYLDIQTEAINPLLPIDLQVKKEILHLYKQGLIDFGIEGLFRDCFAAFIIGNYFELVASFYRIDFFFDFSEANSRIKLENAVQRFEENTTTYSELMYDKKSRLCAYHRSEKLLKQRWITHKQIESMPYKNRLEVRFYKSSFKYMNIENLEGNYYDVAERYLTAIAKSLKKYLTQVMEVYNTEGHPVFQKALLLAGKKHIKSDNKLKCTPTSLMHDEPILYKVLFFSLFTNEEITPEKLQTFLMYQQFIKPLYT